MSILITVYYNSEKNEIAYKVKRGTFLTKILLQYCAILSQLGEYYIINKYIVTQMQETWLPREYKRQERFFNSASIS